MRRLNLAVLLVLAGPAGAIYAGSAFEDPIYGFSTTTDIVYGSAPLIGGTFELKLDLYQPTDIGGGAPPALSPGIVLIHGGGFVTGDKADLAELCQIYATYGYTVVSTNYRMYLDGVPETHGPADYIMQPGPPFPVVPVPDGLYTINAAVEDATTAMAWMRSNAALYNVDPNRIAIGGGSAGAITSLLQAYNSPPADVAPQAVLSFLGAMYGTEETIQAGDVPAFVVASSNDDTVPFDAPLGAQATINRMNAVGVVNEFYVQEIGHGVDFYADFGGQTLIEHNMEFLAAYLAPEPSGFVLCALAALALAALGWRRKRGRR